MKVCWLILVICFSLGLAQDKLLRRPGEYFKSNFSNVQHGCYKFQWEEVGQEPVELFVDFNTQDILIKKYDQVLGDPLKVVTKGLPAYFDAKTGIALFGANFAYRTERETVDAYLDEITVSLLNFFPRRLLLIEQAIKERSGSNTDLKLHRITNSNVYPNERLSLTTQTDVKSQVVSYSIQKNSKLFLQFEHIPGCVFLRSVSHNGFVASCESIDSIPTPPLLDESLRSLEHKLAAKAIKQLRNGN